MARHGKGLLTARALWRLALYDVRLTLRGFRAVYRDMERRGEPSGSGDAEWEREVCEAVALASSLYWKPVQCLQRSAAIASLLRRRGVDAQVVIGFQPAPLASHAWVEVEGRVVGDSPAYRWKLRPLTRV
ncbi:MAG TPA: lasso peptide biosynthesis B2 protein [Bryobacteraceae bacterium]|nr:lasso peptide biosynthesis B2 protein [Bryobacteraceae bacterium]